MKINKIKYIYIFILSILCTVAVHAQKQYWYQSNIKDSIPEDGYYDIELSPEIIGILNNNSYQKIRIFDNANNEVPYLRKTYKYIEEGHFIPYKIKSQTIKDSLNTIIIDNEKQDNLNKFNIFIKSADTKKSIQVRGSNNLSQWYIVKQMDNVSFIDNQSQKNEEILVTNFPQGNYKYYEISLITNTHSPVDVERVGYFEETSTPIRQLTEVDLGIMSVKDSTDKKTYIRFPKIDNRYAISDITFRIESPKNYRRDIQIINQQEYNELRYLSSQLSSEKNNYFISEFIFDNKTQIVIDNKDDRPLKVGSIKAFSTKKFVTAFLEKGKTYKIHIDDPKYSSVPEYDLVYLENKIPDTRPSVKTEQVLKIEKPEGPTKAVRQPYWFEKPLFMWSAIILVGLFLTFICYKTAKDMNKKAD